MRWLGCKSIDQVCERPPLVQLAAEESNSLGSAGVVWPVWVCIFDWNEPSASDGCKSVGAWPSLQLAFQITVLRASSSFGTLPAIWPSAFVLVLLRPWRTRVYRHLAYPALWFVICFIGRTTTPRKRLPQFCVPSQKSCGSLLLGATCRLWSSHLQGVPPDVHAHLVLEQ